MKPHTLILALIAFTSPVMAQTAEDLVLWDFRSTVGITTSFDYALAPVTPDAANANNATSTFFTEGRKITGQNGYVFSTGWLFNEVPKYWIFENVNTYGYYSLSFMFDMGASSGNAPRDFEVEYLIKDASTWISLGTLMSPQGFATKTYPLPRECEDTLISVRIRLISNYKINGVNEAQTNTQNRLKNGRVVGYLEPTEPSVVTSLSTYSLCDVAPNTSTTIVVDITGKQLTGPLTLSVPPPFVLNKNTLNPINKSVSETIEVNLTPVVAGEYNERLTISGGGAEPKLINLRVVASGYQLPTHNAPVPGVQKNFDLQFTSSGFSVRDTKEKLIEVFDISGLKLIAEPGVEGLKHIAVPGNGLYIVRIGDFITKVIN